jgi:hypothetical protein
MGGLCIVNWTIWAEVSIFRTRALSGDFFPEPLSERDFFQLNVAGFFP